MIRTEFFTPDLNVVKDLIDVEYILLEFLERLKTQGFKIIYAIGNYPARADSKTFIFSAQDIFTKELLAKLGKVNQQDLASFWRSILKTGKLDVIYLSPGWTTSADEIEQLEIARDRNKVVIFGT